MRNERARSLCILAKDLEGGSEHQIEAFNDLCETAEALGIDFAKHNFVRATNDEIADYLLKWIENGG